MKSGPADRPNGPLTRWAGRSCGITEFIAGNELPERVLRHTQ